ERWKDVTTSVIAGDEQGNIARAGARQQDGLEASSATTSALAARHPCRQHPVVAPNARAQKSKLGRHDVLRSATPIHRMSTIDPRMARGWLSDRYCVRAALTLAHAGRDLVVTRQLFAKTPGTQVGVWDSIRMLQTQLAAGYDVADLQVDPLLEGERFEPWETV